MTAVVGSGAPTVFEINHPALLKVKDARLAQALARPRCQRITVGADLTGE